MVVLLLPILMFGCHAPDTMDIPEEMPEDFYITYEVATDGNNFLTLLDTQNDTIGYLLGNHFTGAYSEYVSMTIIISNEDLQRKYELVKRYKILAYDGLYFSKEPNVTPDPYYETYRITLHIDGKISIVGADIVSC